MKRQLAYKDSWHNRCGASPTRCCSAPHVRPDLQEHGIGKALLAKSIAQLEVWGTRHVGLFSFAHSAEHVELYQRYDFSSRFLTAVPVAAGSQPIRCHSDRGL